MRNPERDTSEILLLLIGILLALLACAGAAPVVQGKVVAVGAGGLTLSVQDELRPEDPPLVIDVASAEIGATPAVGDRVRLVYRIVAARPVALRVMNIARGGEPGKAT